MRNVTRLLALALFCCAAPASGQKTDFIYHAPLTNDVKQPYSNPMLGGQFSGSLSVTGPFDLDGDGKKEVLLTDYSGGQRVHVFEVQGKDQWKLVYSTPYHEQASNSTRGARYATGGDLDGDGKGEIIFISGHRWAASENNPVSSATGGIFIYEFTGKDNDYGSAPAAAFGPTAFATPAPPFIKSDNFSVRDVDGDGVQELLFPNDSSTPWDEWYVFSVNGDIGSGFETFVPELRLSSRNNPEVGYDPVLRGGGSTYGVNAVDFDGDGRLELSLHAWNNLNLTNARVLSANTYDFPKEGAPNLFLQASGNDDLSWLNGVAVDINGDGDQEMFYPREYGYEDEANGKKYEYVTVVNYEKGEDVLQITKDQVKLDLVGPLTAYGIAAGDVDGDGKPELIGAGRGYDGADLTAGRKPAYLRVAKWMGGTGGNPEDANNYQMSTIRFDITASDSLFNTIHRDSLGTKTTYYESTGGSGAFPNGKPEELSPNRIAYLGDVDGDGFPEVAAAFFGINDTLLVFDETWNAVGGRYDRTFRTKRAVKNRPVMRIFEINAKLGTAVEDNAPLPSGFTLSAAYPNPFNPSTQFSFTLPSDQRVTVRVYDVMGRLVQTLVDGRSYTGGTHEVRWDATNAAGAAVASGTYLITLEAGPVRLTRTVAFIK